MRRLVLLIAVIALAAQASSAAMDQQGTPFAGREVPDPSTCTVEPRSPDILAQTPVAATPEATPATPQAVTVPSGNPADAATTSAITDVIRQLYACLNGGDTLRVLALFTDPAAVKFLAIRPDLAIPPTNATPPASPPEARIAIVAIDNVTTLPDGRVFALVTQDDPARPPEGPEPIFVYFAKQDDHWLIDDFLPLATSP
ncbi:MAG: hypothetical protein ACJ789_15530 [Thermomicrobiales bacterium]